MNLTRMLSTAATASMAAATIAIAARQPTVQVPLPAQVQSRTAEMAPGITQFLNNPSGPDTTQSQLGSFQGEMSLIFANNGTANGTYGQDEGSTRIFL